MTYDLEPFRFGDEPAAPRSEPAPTPKPPAPGKGGAAIYALAGASLGLLGMAGAAVALAALFSP